MTDSGDAVAWLNGCYDRAEQRALAVGAAIAVHTYAPVEVEQHRDAALSWRAQRWLFHKKVVAGGEQGGWGPPKVTDSTWAEVADHIADHDPSWRLAEIARHRAILDECVADLTERGGGALEGAVDRTTWRVIGLLAEEFNGEPGYDERWQQ